MRGEAVGRLDGAVAIVGVGGVFPLARDAATFWANVHAGRDCIRELPPDRFDASLFYDPDPRAPERSYCRVAGYVDEIPVDPRQLRIPPLVWRSMDRFQQLALAAAVEAFADAGLDHRPFDRDRAGVFLGFAGGRSDAEADAILRVQHPVVEQVVARRLEDAGMREEDVDRVLADLRTTLLDPLVPITEDTMSGSLPNVAAGRIASHFDLRGMSCVLDSACASTLAALQRALDALRLGEVDLALVGGFHAMVGAAIQIAFSKFHGLSPERVRPFDARADGFVLGEGAGIFVAKRLPDAVRDGDRVYAVVRGVGCSSDGREKGIGAPNPRAQALAMRRAYEDAEIDPGTVQYVETHGAGTAVGDPAEIDAMLAVFGPSRVPGRTILLGAIKSHVGHLMGAAGAAGLMATILGLHHRVVPPALNHEVGNPAIPWDETPFQVATTAQPWPDSGKLPPRAGVSAFGFGGTNFHAVLEAYESSFHGDARWPHPVTREPVAVIGLAAVLPCGEGPDAIWESIAGRRSAIVELPRERLEGQPELFRSAEADAPDRTRGTIGATVETPELSASEFRIPPTALAQLDPEQRLIMACGARALRDASLIESEVDHTRTTVVLGETTGCQHTLWNSQLRLNAPRVERALRESAPLRALMPGEAERATLAAAVREELVEGRLPTTEETVLAQCAQIGVARLMKAFDLMGLQLLVDAACASSLGAIGAAVDALRTRRADVVLTGGVAPTITPSALATFSKAGGLSPTGSRPFAADADGATFGEGAAMVVLKRLGDAIRDGDRIRAVVRGVGASSDGRGRGMTAPDAEGQALAIHRACEEAGCDPSSVQLVECHATATQVGDATELEAMRLAYGGGRTLRVGSIKSQIGHLAGGAGAAGLVKLILGLERRTLPPTLLAGAARPGLVEGNGGGFVLVHEPEPWPENADGEPRRAGVSAFGFGGTNYHLVVEEYVAAYHKQLLKLPDGRVEGEARPDEQIEPVLVAAGGPSLAEALQAADGVAAAALDGAPLAEEARVLRRSAAASPARLTTVADDVAALVEKLALARRELARARRAPQLEAAGVYAADDAELPGRIAVLFPGQGCHYPDMLRHLYARHELVRATFREADAALVGLVPAPLEQLVFTGDGRDTQDVEALLSRSEVVQPVVVTASVAVFRLLAAAGLRPDVTAGHSLGEYAALVAAGVLTLGDAVRVAHARGAAMARLAERSGAGAMAAIASPAEAVEPVVRAVSGLVVVANRNSPSQTVVAGTTEAVAEALRVLEERYMPGRLLPIAGAFHSELARPARTELAEALAAVEARQGAIPVLSSVDGAYLPRDGAARERVRALLTEQLTAPVDFVALVERLYADGVRTFVEAGPRRTLATFVDEILGARPHVALPSDDHRVPPVERLPRALASLLAAGVPVEPDRLDDAQATAGEVVAAAPGRRSARRPRPSVRDGGGPDEEPLVVSGLAVGLPGKAFRVFSDDGVERLLDGQSLIDTLGGDEQDRIVEKRIVRLVKPRDGDPRLEEVRDRSDAIKLAGQRGSFDLADWGITDERIRRADPSFQLAVAAGLEGLRDAGIPLQHAVRHSPTGRAIPGGPALPEPLQDDTAVLFATAYPGYHVLVGEVSAFLADRYGSLAADGLRAHYLERIEAAATPEERAQVDAWFAAEQSRLFDGGTGAYRFNPDFLTDILCSGNVLFAQLVQARGPNVQLNAACASTTVALAAAEDMIRCGRAERAVVLAADDVTSGPVLEWIAAGFLAAGAAATDGAIEDAALPFDARRHGMLIGMGAVCLVVERADAVRERGMEPIAELLGVRTGNSAGHPTRPDPTLAGELLTSLLDDAERRHGLDRRELAEQLLYMSHETYTPARNGIAEAEVQMLREAFGDSWTELTVANVKGLTGHPQAAGLEDAVALRALQLGRLPTLPAHVRPDPALAGLRLSRGGPTDLRYALHYSAGFGGHAAVSLSRVVARGLERMSEPDRYAGWLETVTGIPGARADVVGRTLGVREPPAGPAGLPVPDVSAPPAPLPMPLAPSVVEPVVSVVPVVGGGVAEVVLAVVEERTGYERELLELDLDLEADLGIDTIKQAQILAELGERFGIALDQDELVLGELSTLRRVIEQLELRVAAAPGPDLSLPLPPLAPSVVEPVVSVVPVVGGGVAEVVLAVVEERTGYERELLELDLDLEADLGIDTIKQAQILAELGERFGIALDQDELVLGELSTLRRVIEQLELRVAAAPGPDLSLPLPPLAPSVVEPVVSVVPVVGGGVAEVVLAVVEERTGYERELLELDLDLEADLGIDTIKQAQILAELGERFGIALDQDELVLGELSTLRRVIEQLELRVAAAPGPDLSLPLPPLAPSVVEPVVSVVPVVGGGVAEVVLAVVEERTGYERELLELDLDLEADLGIDTIKQAQILAELGERFGIALDQDELVLGELSTLRRVIEQLELRVAAGTPSQRAEVLVPVTSGRIVRYAVTSMPAPLELEQPGLRIGAGWNVLVVDGDPVEAAAVCESFASRGACAVPVTLPAAPSEPGHARTRAYHEAVLEAVRDAREGLGPVHGVVLLSDLSGPLDPAALSAAALRAELRRRVQGPFAVLQGLHADLERATHEQHAFVLAASSSGCPVAGALSGLLKSLARELPELVVRAVSTPRGAVAPELLLAELERGGVEVTYSDGERRVPQLVPEPLDRTAPRFVLGSESVLLLVGGGRGITAAIARELAAAYGPTLVLWGTTPLPVDVSHLAGLDADGLAALRRELAKRRRARDPGAPPVVLDEDYRTALRAIEIQRTIDDLERGGAAVRYEVVDVCDEHGVRRGLDALLAEHGRLDAVVFGAGTIEDKLLADKDPISFERVLHVKALGIGILLAALRGREPDVFAGLSSIAGRLGNRGQADYAAANGFLAATLATTGVGRRIAIDWTVWDEVGLAARGGATALLRDAGLDVLSPADGARLFRDELVFGEGGEVAIAGDLGPLAGETASAPGFDEVLAHEPGARLVATRTFAPGRDVWLADHVVAGSPWLPAVAGIELMARAAAVLAPSLRIAEIENLEIPLAVKVLRGRPATVRVTAEAEPAGSNGDRRVSVQIESDVVRPDGTVLQRDRLHYRATVVCCPGAAEPPPAPRAPGNGTVPTAVLYGPGGLLPHGPAFQPVERLVSLGDEGASGVVVAGSPQLSLPGVSAEPPLTAPLAREAALQVSGVWGLLCRGVLALPSGCRRIELFGPVPSGVRLRAEALVRRVDAEELEFDLVLVGDDGRLYDRMSGYRAVRVGEGPRA